MDNNTALYSLCSVPLHGVSLFTDSKPAIKNKYALRLSSGKVESPSQESAIWKLTDKGERYTSVIELHRENDRQVLVIDCEGKGAFEFTEEGIKVDWHANGTGPAHYLQTIGLSVFLEQKGHLCLHANTLVKEGQAHLFLAPSRTGKSTLTTALTHEGFTLTTDDMAALFSDGNAFSVYPSWPKVRLWPDSTEYFADSASFDKTTVKKVHDRFAKNEITFTGQMSEDKPAQISALYFLNRAENYTGPVEITRIANSKALILLMQNSMLGDAYKALGIDKQRVGSLATLINTLPVYEIKYPDGLERLTEVCRQINEWISAKNG